MVAVSRYAVSRSLLLLSLLVGCDGNPVDPSGPLFRITEAPSSTTAVAVSESRVDVSWLDTSPNEIGFEVHRSTTGPGGTFTLLATTGANVTSYSDTGLTSSAQYCYVVRSFNRSGKQTSYSAFSSVACARTPAPPPPPPPPPPSEQPAAPGPLTADVSPWRIVLWWHNNSWQDGVNKEDGFRIERCQGVVCVDADFAVIAVIITGDNFYLDGDVEPGTTYTYRVRAFNGAGESAPSNEASATACFVGTDWEGGGYYVCVDP